MTKPECAHSTGAAMTSRRAMRRAIAAVPVAGGNAAAVMGNQTKKEAPDRASLKAGRQAAGRMRNVDRP